MPRQHAYYIILSKFRVTLFSLVQSFQYHSYQVLNQSTKCKMNILDLPIDIIHNILLEAVISRGVTRALRLKLVCSMFKSSLTRMLLTRTRTILQLAPTCFV
jgi:hypothetical protein